MYKISTTALSKLDFGGNGREAHASVAERFMVKVRKEGGKNEIIL